jgi:histidine triad (HIT) family protein
MASNDCVFCKIVSGEIPTEKLYADDLVTAFRDHQPAAPSHVLIVPNQHLVDANALTAERSDLAARLLTAAAEIAKQEGITESGYRLIMNTGPDGRQEVMHLHLHLLGGQRMQHPIG